MGVDDQVKDERQSLVFKHIRDETVRQQMLALKNQLSHSLAELSKIWDDMGVDDQVKDERQSLVFKHISDLMKEMVAEEEKRRQTLEYNIGAYRLSLSEICRELGVAPKKVSATKLFEIEAELKAELKCWSDEKDDRLKEMTELQRIEKSVCDCLLTTPMYIPTGTIPTRETLTSLREHTDKLASEKARRYATFCSQRDEIVVILEQLDDDVVSEFEQDVVLEQPEDFQLSDKNMAGVLELLTQMREKLSGRKTVLSNLLSSIKSLWERLDIEQIERELILENDHKYTQPNIEMFREELARLDRLKFEHMQDFINKIREELRHWWDLCYYSDSQRNSFKAYRDETYSEQLLLEHETELEKVKTFYENNKDMLIKIEKRRELWNKMVAFDEKENDPNRFRNRGGNLLAEEKEKKRVVSQLPKVEEQLKVAIEQWEKENNREFRIGGMQFFDYCRLQWEEYKMTKELQRQQRMEQKEREMKKELQYGSKPTPAKRRFCGVGATVTPKQRKLDDASRITRSVNRPTGQIHSIFTSPGPANRTAARTPARGQPNNTKMATPAAKTPRQPISTRTPASSRMGPPTRTPMSLRKLNETPRAKSCMSLASPSLKGQRAGGMKSAAKSVSALKKTHSEMKLNSENDVGESSSGISGVTELDATIQSYKEFEEVMKTPNKEKCRSTLCP